MGIYPALDRGCSSETGGMRPCSPGSEDIQSIGPSWSMDPPWRAGVERPLLTTRAQPLVPLLSTKSANTGATVQRAGRSSRPASPSRSARRRSSARGKWAGNVREVCGKRGRTYRSVGRSECVHHEILTLLLADQPSPGHRSQQEPGKIVANRLFHSRLSPVRQVKQSVRRLPPPQPPTPGISSGRGPRHKDYA